MEIDKNYAKSTKWKGIKFLPFIIEAPPKEYPVERVPPIKEKGIFSHFDDEKIIFRLSSPKKGEIGTSNMFFMGAAFVFFGMLLLPKLMDFPFDPPSATVCFMWALIPAAYALYLRMKVRNYPEFFYITFYRLLGLIELPKNDVGNGSFLIPFNDLKALNRSFTMTNYHMGPTIIFIIDPTPIMSPLKGSDWLSMSWSNNPMEYWSFYVWYMDRNRPLPPGSAFDPYRKKDYERRKAEGFPPPLYESLVPTPEYVPGSGGSIVDNLN